MALWSWFARRKRLDLDEDDFRQEVAAHLQIAIDEKIAEGLPPEDARYAALREFGNVTKTIDSTRRVWTPAWLASTRDLASDAQYAIRTLAKNRMFAMTVVAVLAIGIGVNSAVFTMFKAVLISPIAGVKDSSHLTVIFGETATGRQLRLSYTDYKYLRDHDTAFERLIGTAVTRANLGRGRAARQVWAELVTGYYFDVLGVRAQHGRTLMPSDESAGSSVVVIGDGLWRRDFQADPSIVGRTIDVNNQILTVVGIADPRFHGTTVVYDVDLYIPATVAPHLGYTFGSQERAPSAILADRGTTFFFPQGRLRSGVSRADAESRITALWATRPHDDRASDGLERLRVAPFWQTPQGAPGFLLPTLSVLSAMAVLLLLIACANVAGLVVVRGVSRRGEIALRLALGASRGRVVRLLAIETLVLAVPGTFFGIMLANLGIPRLLDYADWLAAPDRLFFNLEVDGMVIAFAAVIAATCALVFGVLPSLQSARVDLIAVINHDASPRGAPRARLRTGLVVTQVAVTLMLLAGAGLVWRNVQAAWRIDPGFDAGGVASLIIDVRNSGRTETKGREFYRTLLETARADAASESVSLAANHPLALQDTRQRPVTIESYQRGENEDLAFMSNTVSPDYFRTLRISLLAGRDFDHRDRAASTPVTIVNATFAERFWGSAAQAVGKRIRVADGDWRTVIGVAADVKYSRIDENPRPYLYLPFEQSYQPVMNLSVRTSSTTVEGLITRARGWVERVDAEQPVLSARPLADRLRGAFIFLDFAASMLFLFGICGMGLAMMGTYGLVSYTVAQTTHEIGIRMALGASACSIIQRLLLRGLRLGAVGAALGLVAAAVVSKIVGSVLFNVSALDPVSFGAALIVVLGGVGVATLLPAWRASRTDPLSALRHR